MNPLSWKIILIFHSLICAGFNIPSKVLDRSSIITLAQGNCFISILSTQLCLPVLTLHTTGNRVIIIFKSNKIRKQIPENQETIKIIILKILFLKNHSWNQNLYQPEFCSKPNPIGDDNNDRQINTRGYLLKELSQMFIKAEQPHNLPSAIWRMRNDYGIIQQSIQA